MGKFIKLFSVVLVVFLYFFSLNTQVKAAALVNVSDQLSTSRPSPAAPLDFNVTTASVSAIIKDNGSYFLASDSAILAADTGETQDTVNVASMSANGTPISNDRVVYLTNTIGHTHHIGDAIYSSITSVHKVQFTTQTGVPAGGKVIITFPGSGLNTATPSATTFSFNGLASGNITVTGATCASWSISAPSITCTLNGSGISASTTVAFYIGCTGVTSGACSTSVPTLINPTASPNQVSGSTTTADTWKVSVATQDSGGNPLDSASIRIATLQSVQVQASVDPTITFTITGLSDGQVVNTVNSNCTGNTDTTNAGINTTPTFVNLGTLANGVINKAIQNLTVSTNSSNGYSITATSSGHLINPSNGFYLQDNEGNTGLTAPNAPVPAAFPASGNTWFGIHACGTNALSQWATGTTTFAGSAKYANPWNTGATSYYDTLTTLSGVPASADITTVEYAGTVGPTTPAGTYVTTVTYIATATF